MSIMCVSDHAKQRWDERFPGLDITEKYLSARFRIGKKMRAVIQKSCPNHKHFCRKTFNGRYMRMTKDGIVFVVAPPETIITVLDCRESVGGKQ